VKRFRGKVVVGDMPFGFRPENGAAGAVFVVRQIRAAFKFLQLSVQELVTGAWLIIVTTDLY